MLSVQWYVPEEENADLEWDDEVDDEEVDHMVELLREGHVFTPHEFRGGDLSIRPFIGQTEGGSARRGGDTAGAASKSKRKPHQKKQGKNPGGRETRSYERERKKENVPEAVEDHAELKEWIAGKLRNMKEELVEYIRSEFEKRDGDDVKEKGKKKETEMGMETQKSKKENVSVKRKGKEKEDEQTRDSEDELDEVIVVGVNNKGKGKVGDKAATSLRRSNRLKRKVVADYGSVDLSSLQKEEKKGGGKTTRGKRRKLEFDVPSLIDEDLDMFSDGGNHSDPPNEPSETERDEGIEEPENNAEKIDQDPKDEAPVDDTPQKKVTSSHKLQMVLYNGEGLNSPIQANPIQLVGYTTPPVVGEKVQSHENSTPPEGSSRMLSDQPPPAPANGRGGKRVPQKSEKISGVYTCDPRIRALFASRTKPAYAPIQTLHAEEWNTFRRTLTAAKEQSFEIITGQTVTNAFFLEIAKPTQWLATPHMQVLTALLVRRRGDILLKDRAVFVDPWFTSFLVSGYALFKGLEVKDKCDWSPNVERFVTGRGGRSGKLMKSMFLKDVDRVYTPMNWGSTHWVGLVINLRFSTIDIYDSYTSITENEEKVVQYMEPVLVSLPWAMKRYLPAEISKSISTGGYTWRRVEGVYQNLRSGDCGACAMKFLEMHAEEGSVEEMGNLTDKDVDTFRVVYAMDSYEEFVGNAEVMNN
ncbi:unnamed protein product [Microthlaspi erraticum]|uniref:Ubiquitin-like protease family profile domain-containing protein n=1 Tax=Microthlaspi erraticum TaxID=1685480 RepID=A0A6D2HSS1_9BRAS|nr:unnamed protein product [Microthlaspi erraticum]